MLVPYVKGPNDLELRDVADPDPGPRDVVLDVHTVGICGTDLGLLALGGIGRPLALGHELTGTISKLGGEVSAFAIGDRVALNPLFNMIGNGGPEGGFAPRLLVTDVVGKPGSLIRLPEEISMEAGALLEPLAVACHAADRLGVAIGGKVAVFGAGPIGLALVSVLRYRGIDDVVVFDLSESRRKRALALGARHAVNPQAEDFRQVLIDLHGKTAFAGKEVPLTSHYLEVTGAPIVGDIISAAAPRATICVVAMHKHASSVEFRDVMAKELTVLGAMGYPDGFGAAVEMMRAGALDFETYVSHRFEGGKVIEAFDTARQTDRSAKVLVRYDTGQLS